VATLGGGAQPASCSWGLEPGSHSSWTGDMCVWAGCHGRWGHQGVRLVALSPRRPLLHDAERPVAPPQRHFDLSARARRTSKLSPITACARASASGVFIDWFRDSTRIITERVCSMLSDRGLHACDCDFTSKLKNIRKIIALQKQSIQVHRSPTKFNASRNRCNHISPI
jgi:hypothetical protein